MKRRQFLRTAGVTSFSLAGMLFLQRPYCAGAAPASEVLPTQDQPDNLSFGGPFGLALDAEGNLLVTDSPRYRWLRIARADHSISSHGKPGSIVGRLNYPSGIAVGPDNLIHVVDSNNCRVQIFDMHGNVKRVVGSIGSIGGSFATPQGVCLDGQGRMIVADTRNHRVQIFLNYELVSVIGDLGDADDQFRLPTACLFSPDKNIVVLDSKHGAVKVFGEDLNFKFRFGAVGSAPGLLNMPQGMDLAPDGTLWIADTGNHRIQQFSLDGKLIGVVGQNGQGPGEFTGPTGIACKGQDLYIADFGNRRIQIRTPKGFETLVVSRQNAGHFPPASTERA